MQDLRPPSRIRRRAGRRDQRRHQVGRQHVQGLAVRALLGQLAPVEQRLRQAAGHRPGHAEQRVLRSGRRPDLQPQRVRRVDRRADRPGPACSSSARCRPASSVRLGTTPSATGEVVPARARPHDGKLLRQGDVRAHQPPAVQPVRPLDAGQDDGRDRGAIDGARANQTTSPKESLESRRTPAGRFRSGTWRTRATTRPPTLRSCRSAAGT